MCCYLWWLTLLTSQIVHSGNLLYISSVLTCWIQFAMYNSSYIVADLYMACIGLLYTFSGVWQIVHCGIWFNISCAMAWFIQFPLNGRYGVYLYILSVLACSVQFPVCDRSCIVAPIFISLLYLLVVFSSQCMADRTFWQLLLYIFCIGLLNTFPSVCHIIHCVSFLYIICVGLLYSVASVWQIVYISLYLFCFGL